MNKRSDEDWAQIPWNDLSTSRKRYILLRESSYACSNCGYNKRREDGKHIVEIDHIDGNHKNNSRGNLRVLCPNCHALTPNFRNYGRSSKIKTGTRLRRENKNYAKVREELRSRELAYEENFRLIVNQAFTERTIDFSKFGWVQRLCELLNDPWPQAVSRRVRRLMPEFYVNNCFVRGKKRL